MDFAVYLNAITALFVIIDPIGAALIFHALLPGASNRVRLVTAAKATLIAAILLLVFGNFGEPLLTRLGISIEALRISGGLLLFYTAFNMITRDLHHDTGVEGKDVSVYPLAIPLLSGPGSLTLSILLFSGATTTPSVIGVGLAIITIFMLTLALMLLSNYVKVVIGNTGDEILRRFLGVVLAALAIQFIADGVTGMMP